VIPTTSGRPTRDEELFRDTHLHRWLDMAGERIAFQACRRGSADRPRQRHRAGLAFNAMVKSNG
jgi:urocanate hydratase